MQHDASRDMPPPGAPPRGSRLLVGLVLAAGLGAALAAASVLWAPRAQAAPKEPQVHWSPCGDGFECATANVPLDHSGGDGGTIQLSLIRLPATNPDERIGSLFVNPGGPGGSGVDMVRGSAAFFPAELRERYDIVGFDPRGIARSTPVRCFGNVDQATDTLAPLPFPVTDAQEQTWRAADRELADACDQRARRIMDHMTTADVARDLDILRQAVDDEKLRFLGASYGSYLGTTYANMFPERTGRVVIDGVLDPVAWATGREGTDHVPFSTRLESHEGAQATLEEFFRLCDAAARNPGDAASCAFGPGSQQRFADLAASLRDQPLEIVLPGGATREYTYAQLVSNALSSMYSPGSWPFFSQYLASLESLAGDPASTELAQQAGARFADLDFVNKRGRPAYPNFVEGFPGVACSDTDNPDSFSAWSTAADAADQSSYFGSPWTWTSSICAMWPGDGPDRYTGPWDADTAEPVMVVGNRYDPATPHHGAQTVHRLLPDSKLLTYEGWGHVALGRTACVDRAIVDYLLGEPTPDRASCPVTGSPFAGPALPPAPGSASAGHTRFPAALRTAGLPG